MAKFKCHNCGKCCGPIPITMDELTNIRKALDDMPRTMIDRIKANERDKLTCILLDIESKRCLVYNSRPFPCRQYGSVSGMICPRNKLVPIKSKFLADRELRQNRGMDLAGILSHNIGWESLI